MSDYEYEVRQLICEAHEMNALIVRQTSELASLRAALDAAQDEIEKRITEAEETRPIVQAARAEQFAEHQLTQWQATLLVFGGLSWGPLNGTLLDAAVDYLSDCRVERRAAVRAIEDALGGAS